MLVSFVSSGHTYYTYRLIQFDRIGIPSLQQGQTKGIGQPIAGLTDAHDGTRRRRRTRCCCRLGIPGRAVCRGVSIGGGSRRSIRVGGRGWIGSCIGSCSSIVAVRAGGGMVAGGPVGFGQHANAPLRGMSRTDGNATIATGTNAKETRCRCR